VVEVHAGLVRRAQQGDQQAFEVLAAGVIDSLHSIAALILHDPTLADDAVQETLVRVWRDLPRLRDAERFEGWLHSILSHSCLDLLRRERRTVRTDPLPPTLADHHRVDVEIANRDAVDRALRRLTVQHRAVLVLRHYVGYSSREVANVLKLPLGTVKSRLHYAERAMHAAVDADARMVPVRGELA
jgi:RNA polymerase sigma-70 factor (ECF subfamily)